VSGLVFIFCAPALIFDGIEGIGMCYNIFRFRTYFGWYWGRRFQFSSFALLDSFSAVPRASNPFFMFCALGLIFDGIEGVGYCFLILLSWTHFRLYRGRRVQFSCFALSDSFLAVPRASCLVFIFCAPALIFDGTEGAGSSFNIFRFQTYFGWY
jgi:hypothetical protein